MYPRAKHYPSPIPSGSADVNVGRVERALSVAGGIALTVAGLRKRNLAGFAGALGGIALIYRGISGHCGIYERLGRDSSRSDDEPHPVHVQTAMSIARPRAEVYAVWRNLENLPLFMKHLASVRAIDERRSEWSAEIPGRVGSLHWEAEIVEEEPDRRIAWRSVAGADVDNSGQVEFSDSSDGQTTELLAEIAYRPPAGYLGAQLGRLLNPAFERMIHEDLRRFKEMMEGGKLGEKGLRSRGAEA